MKNITLVPSEKAFFDCANRELNLTTEEAGMLLGYILGHGCGVYLDEADTIVVVDIEDPENGIIASGIEELLERVISWNYEFLQDSEVVGPHREQILKDAEILDRLTDGCHIGHPLGYPTVKELIAALSNLPEDYRVTCCGAECFVHAIRDSIKQEMLDRDVEELTAGAYIIRWTSVLSNRFDTTGFKKVYGDLYKAFTKQTSSRRFSISC